MRKGMLASLPALSLLGLWSTWFALYGPPILLATLVLVLLVLWRVKRARKGAVTPGT